MNPYFIITSCSYQGLDEQDVTCTLLQKEMVIITSNFFQAIGDLILVII